jgi:hypothetical protein
LDIIRVVRTDISGNHPDGVHSQASFSIIAACIIHIRIIAETDWTIRIIRLIDLRVIRAIGSNGR